MFQKSECGFATLLILILLFSLSAYGTEMYCKASIQNRIAKREVQARQAIYAAEAGLELAKASLKNDLSWREGTVVINNGNVVVTVEAKDEGYWLTSLAQVGFAQRKIRLFLKWEQGRWLETRYQEVHS